MPKVQLVGATGYGGLGMLELILAHPDFEISGLCAWYNGHEHSGHKRVCAGRNCKCECHKTDWIRNK